MSRGSRRTGAMECRTTRHQVLRRRSGSARWRLEVLICLLGATLLATEAARSQSQPLGGSFTYQGQLRQGGSLADGPYDLRFELHDISDPSSAPLDTTCFDDVVVQNGLFTVDLDFGAAQLTGERRWLKISVRPDVGDSCDTGTYEDLAPLQEITPAPQATFALQAGSALMDNVEDGDASPLNELNQRFELVGNDLELEDAGGTLSVDLTSITGGDGYSLDAHDGGPVDALYVDDEGDVGIGTTSAASKLDVRGDVSLNDHELLLRAGTDTQSGLGWYGATKPYGGLSTPPFVIPPSIPDGPVLYGNSGGGLGVTQGSTPLPGIPPIPPREILSWRESTVGVPAVGINTTSPEATLHVHGNAQDYAMRVERHDGTPTLLVRSDGGVGIGRNALGATTLTVRGISSSAFSFPLIVSDYDGSPQFLLRNDGLADVRGPLDVTGALRVSGDVDLQTSLDVTGYLNVQGDVGLGAPSPDARLYVEDTISGPDNQFSSYVARFRNRATSSGPDVLLLEVDAEPADRSTNFVYFVAGAYAIGAIENDVDSGPFDDDGVEYSTSGSDFAETLPLVDDAEEIAPGDVVGIFGGKISRRTEGADWVMAVSTNPAFVGNRSYDEDAERRLAIAFVGQVYVRVRGPVERGDYIVASGREDGTGVAVAPLEIRPEQVSRIVGRAWESSSGLGETHVRTIVGLPASASTVEVIQGEVAAVRRETHQEVDALSARLARLERRLAPMEPMEKLKEETP